jgi:NAD(P)-dependent dehydrogenase (short-subunit alcohol dehydrogenase family)
MDTLAVRELAARLPVEQGKVVINAICPGLCKTELIRNCPPAQKQAIIEQHELYGRTAEDGSRTLLAGSVLGKESHGAYTSNCEIRECVAPSL